MTSFWLHTHTGRAFDLLNPQPDQICIEDIAHALASINRYTGHAHRPLSVAEHSVACAYTVHREHGQASLAWEALMHDAHEAYVGDVASPIKLALRALSEPSDPSARGHASPFDSLEATIANAVRTRYDLPLSLAGAITVADLRMLATEAPHVLPWPPPKAWSLPSWAVPYEHATGESPRVPLHMDPATARRCFLDAVVKFGPAFAADEAREAIAVQP